AAALAARSQVVYAQAAYHVHATMVPNDPNYSVLQWNLPLVNMERAWDIQPDAASTVTVAVLDTGVAYRNATITVNIPAFRNAGINYPALGASVVPYAAAPQLVGANGANASRIVAPFDILSNGVNPPLDFEGHGTHVSGTIGQLTNDNVGEAGIAFNVKLMPVKVLGSFWDVKFGSAPFEGGSDDDVARGIHYAADNGAKIINMSLGSFIFQQTFDFNFTDTFDPTVVPPSQYRAPRFDVLANIGIIGTSMATPHVSGIAAMLVQQGITDPAAIEEALEKSAVDIGTPGRDNSFGFGLVD